MLLLLSERGMAVAQVFTFTTFVVGAMDPLFGENAVVSVVLSCYELLGVFTFGYLCSYCYPPGRGRFLTASGVWYDGIKARQRRKDGVRLCLMVNARDAGTFRIRTQGFAAVRGATTTIGECGPIWYAHCFRMRRIR